MCTVYQSLFTAVWRPTRPTVYNQSRHGPQRSVPRFVKASTQCRLCAQRERERERESVASSERAPVATQPCENNHSVTSCYDSLVLSFDPSALRPLGTCIHFRFAGQQLGRRPLPTQKQICSTNSSHLRLSSSVTTTLTDQIFSARRFGF